MDPELKLSLVALAVALSTGVVGVVPVWFLKLKSQWDRERTENELAIQRLKRAAVDASVEAVAEKALHEPVPNKIAEAMRLADRDTPSRIVITSEDIQAGVARRRASLPTSSAPPPTSSAPPALVLPAPAGLPEDWKSHLERDTRPDRGGPR